MRINKHFSDLLWDLWCVCSVVGIWPRFIEPNLLKVKHLTISLPHLPEALRGFKIVQFSDLHLNHRMSDQFLAKIQKKVQALNPDVVVFTGDFLCYSQLKDKDRLANFLKGFKAPYGCYAVLGNHDYSATVGVNEEGEYDIIVPSKKSMISQGISRLCHTTYLARRSTGNAKATSPHAALLELLSETPFKLLDNASVCLSIQNSGLNICGLGEYTLGKTVPEKAFADYDSRYPGVILLHNPDGLPLLEKYPGDIVLSGHTHGGQVNLPWMWRKFTLLENQEFKSGLVHSHGKWMYVNRGVGAVMPFRWFALPEVLCLTLEAAP